MLRANKCAGSIQFVFDGQGGLGNNTSIWFRTVRASLPAALRLYLSKAPTFEDDKTTPALQASDALAWHLRRSRMPEYSSENRPVLDLLRGSTHAEAWIPDELLQAWAQRFATMPGITSVRNRKGSVRKTFEAAEAYIGRLPEEEQDRAFNQFTNWIEQLAKRHSRE
jgi:PAS domain-containing protein